MSPRVADLDEPSLAAMRDALARWRMEQRGSSNHSSR